MSHPRHCRPIRASHAWPALGLLALATGLPAPEASAQSATPGSVLEEILVSAERNPVAQRLDASAGGTAIVIAKDMPATPNLTLGRALAGVPGVVVQNFFGGNDQPRVQVRGSGLQQNPVERGVLVLQNGLPLNRADGSYVVGFAAPGEAEAIEVYRGYMANRLGATVLGGALNLISPTGRSAPGLGLSAGGGSFGQHGGSARYGLSHGDADLLVQGDYTGRDGYRSYNQSRRANVGANFGVRMTDALTLRLYAGHTDPASAAAAPLTRYARDRDPRSVSTGPAVTPTGAINPGPNVRRDRPSRDAVQYRAGARATQVLGAHLIDFAIGRTRTDDEFRFPMSAGIRTTTGDDTTAVLRYAYKPDADRGALPVFELTALYVTGAAERGNHLNLAGRRGPLFGRSHLEADTLSLNASLHLALGAGVSLSPSLSWARATRANGDRYDSPTRPTAAYNPANPTVALPAGAVPTVESSYARRYEGASPALGITWHPSGNHPLFGAISRSFEPPTHDDLLATVNGTPNSSAGRPSPGAPGLPAAVFATPALAAQRATTVEIGWRGGAGPVTWDAVVYRSWVRDELLSLRDASGAPLGAANAPRTRHLGAELGFTAQVSPDVSARLAYTWQEFRFEDDPLRGDHALAGAPRHWVHAALDWRPTDRWHAGAALRWMPRRTPVDNLGTLYNAPFATLDLRAARRFGSSLSVFAEVTNLFDEVYAASPLVVDQARADQAAFMPGDGRAFGIGVRLGL